MKDEVSIKDVLNYTNAKIIDLRSKYKYSLGHIPNSQNIDVDDILETPNEFLNFEDTYFLYCEYGFLSKRIAETLHRIGYQIYSIKGGYYAYLEYQSMI